MANYSERHAGGLRLLGLLKFFGLFFVVIGALITIPTLFQAIFGSSDIESRADVIREWIGLATGIGTLIAGLCLAGFAEVGRANLATADLTRDILRIMEGGQPAAYEQDNLQNGNANKEEGGKIGELIKMHRGHPISYSKNGVKGGGADHASKADAEKYIDDLLDHRRI